MRVATKFVQIVRKSLPSDIVTILPSIIDNSTPKRPFNLKLYCQIASRIIKNQEYKLLNMGLTPHPLNK